MPRYEKHIFVCTNQRPAGHPKGCCAEKGSGAVLDVFKRELAQRGLKGRMRANAAGCLDMCEFGPTVVVYPEGVWYSVGTEADAIEIIEKHLLNDEIVTRLLMPDRGRLTPVPDVTL
ncbi:MAG: (2Fe-2S) ferredoxin domain-containing protein [Acidobacteria bacterium]|nr:(2Fe-2S) ferredoxin domain-containing protein [Acidobacteriota bacterium]MBI3658624.1 (2Fe-2S) ferredoxin domain-containing protein [Acidobacteriota bacterium]